MGRRRRKTRPAPKAPAAAPAPPPAPPPSRSELKDAAARAALEPLAAGERPTVVTVAAIVAAILAVANVAMWLAGVEVEDGGDQAGGVIVFAALMGVAAAGMWRAKYWAVLGFQALLALSVVFAALSLIVASNLAAVALCLAIVGLGGWLFWKLVGAMARIQMPQRPRT